MMYNISFHGLELIIYVGWDVLFPIKEWFYQLCTLSEFRDYMGIQNLVSTTPPWAHNLTLLKK